MKLIRFLMFFLVLVLVLIACTQKSDTQKPAPKQLSIITTLFPVYDFANIITGSKAHVQLLLPPGVEPHHFEPKPEDMIKLNKADVFIYTSRHMEAWAQGVVKSLQNPKIVIVDASEGIKFHKAIDDTHTKHHHEHQTDPHVWLDFANASVMVDNILAGIIKADSQNADFYKSNAQSLKDKLTLLDASYKTILKNCKHRNLIHAGHYAFGYLAKKYDLKYIPAFPSVSAEGELTAKHLAELLKTIKKTGAKYIFYEELTSSKLANSLAKDTGLKLLELHSAHNVSKAELDKGVSFVSIMQKNLNNLQTGLQCE